ncbi:MAG: hypothetical protein IM638_14620 [Bacteroidetes bacterium]|nr:hypothetical protein [Bacteroidota bacterium]
MKTLLLSLFLFPGADVPAEVKTESAFQIKNRHIEFTRYIQADLLTVKETGGNSIWVARINCFRHEYKVVGELNTLHIKAKRS